MNILIVFLLIVVGLFIAWILVGVVASVKLNNQFTDEELLEKEIGEHLIDTALIIDDNILFPRQYIQRDLRISYARAQRIVEKLEQIGLITFKEDTPSILVVNQPKVKEFLQKRGLKSTSHLKMKRTLLNRVKSEFQLNINNLHGASHWKRVEKLGLHLSQKTKADTTVVSLFAILHDSRRVNEESDPEHGAKAALFARQLYKEGYLEITATQLDRLITACKIHSDSQAKVDDVTIATCLDADRIDLLRLGITPEEELLYTPASKEFVASSELENLYKELTSSVL